MSTYILHTDMRCIRQSSIALTRGSFLLTHDTAVAARVKLGVDARTGETVAVKIMYKDNMSARAAQQLRREITSMKALNHPNVLRLKDVHEVCMYVNTPEFTVHV